MRMWPFVRPLSRQLEAQGLHHRAQYRGAAARNISQQRPAGPAMDGNSRVHLPEMRHPSRGRGGSPGYPIVHDFSQTSKVSTVTGWANRWSRQAREADAGDGPRRRQDSAEYGGGLGLGRASSLLLASEGARLVVTDIDESLAGDTARGSPRRAARHWRFVTTSRNLRTGPPS